VRKVRREVTRNSFWRLRHGEPETVSSAIGYAMYSSRSHSAVIRVYDASATWSKRTSTRPSSKS